MKGDLISEYATPIVECTGLDRMFQPLPSKGVVVQVSGMECCGGPNAGGFCLSSPESGCGMGPGTGGTGGSGAGGTGGGGSTAWQSFEVNTASAFLGPTIRLVQPSGQVTVTRNGMTTNATLSPQDRATLFGILADSGFVAAMGSGFTCPPAPADIGVSFSLTQASGQALASHQVTGCALASQPLAGPEEMARMAFQVVSKY